MASETKLSNLSVGVHVANRPFTGFKFLKNCVSKQYSDRRRWMMAADVQMPDISDIPLCSVEIEIPIGATIVRPRVTDTTEEPSDSFRVSDCKFGQMNALGDGCEPCVSGISPFKDFPWASGQTAHESVNENIYYECMPGIHCVSSKEALIPWVKRYTGK